MLSTVKRKLFSFSFRKMKRPAPSIRESRNLGLKDFWKATETPLDLEWGLVDFRTYFMKVIKYLAPLLQGVKPPAVKRC